MKCSRCHHDNAPEARYTLRRGLAHLQEAELLYETQLFPDPEYTFKHALTHEVTYGTLLQARRRALHARIVGAIEGFYPAREMDMGFWLEKAEAAMDEGSG